MDPETAVYVLYIAELWIDDGKQKAEILYAYGLNQRHALDNFQQWLSPAGWLFAHLDNIKPHPEGYRINDDLLLEGVITHDGYRIFQDQLAPIV
ncbi:hypothetical protein [Ktedonobacter robiniae]|jgi:hypothetical protein|uniref:Uncharacterized protein n=1 Tax=Ktedonobacter robiniae TaxID=2778365 RepID=A0ABQ3UIC5_9CHLR|nr:hypothetical protein [Ktedonobacter robiniae]GHO52453.1 hypothetical protein KSB_09280 [Ktedonobacter robiniae]